jgi:hypothetical protein
MRGNRRGDLTRPADGPCPENVMRKKCVRGRLASRCPVVLTALLFFAVPACGGKIEDAPEHVSSTTNKIVNNVEVGTRCQQDYENGWKDDVGNNDVWNRCNNFFDEVTDYQTPAFQYNLHSAVWAFEQPDTCGWPCGNANAVDFLYVNTHGGSNSADSYWTMWDQGSYVDSAHMRLGDTGRENMVLSMFTCNSHTTDAYTWTRWHGVFAGGMFVTTGGHGLLYSGNDQSGTEYADRLNNGEPIVQSWNESTWYADNRNTPTGIVTGANSTDCSNRMNGFSFNNFFFNRHFAG